MRPLKIAAETGDWGEIDMQKVTPELINSIRYAEGSLLHIAAWAQKLKHFPKNLITEESILSEDKHNSSVLHIAAENNELHVLPKELLTQENLEKVNTGGNTVIHCAAIGGCLKHIPDKLLTDRSISLENNSGKNSLDLAFKQWNPKRKDTYNAPIKNEIDLIISKLGNQRLKMNIEKSNLAITEHKKVLKSTTTKSTYDEIEKRIETYIFRKNLMSRELIKRTFAKRNEKSIEI